MTVNTREELEQLLEDIQSRLSVIETAQTQTKDEESSEEEHKGTSEEAAEVESEDEIEKLLNA